MILKNTAVGIASVAIAMGTVLVTGSAAHAADAPAGHTDIVEIECGLDGVPEFGSHIGGTHYDPDQLDDWTFRYPASSAAVSHGSGAWSVDADLDANVPDAGFNYEVVAGAEGVCPEEVVVTILNEDVTFEGSDTVTLGQNEHQHGVWSFASASATQQTYNVGFDADAGAAGTATYDAAEFVVGS